MFEDMSMRQLEFERDEAVTLLSLHDARSCGVCGCNVCYAVEKRYDEIVTEITERRKV